MPLLSTLDALFSGEQNYSTDITRKHVTLDQFTHNDFDFVRTSHLYFKKPIDKAFYKKITSSEYNFHRSAWIGSIRLSQAKGLLKYTQLSFDL